jgi:Invasion associated locus B (IalB) protein
MVILRTMILRPIRILALCIAASAWSLPGLAQSPKPISTFTDWTAYTVKEEGGLACYMASQPKSSAPDGVNRGQIWTLVTQRPYKKIADEISIYVGYPFEKGSEAVAEIDGQKFSLFTDNETAWAASPELDAKLVEAMRKGAKLTVYGVSERGTKTTDVYSLSGFTAAHNAISKACK